MSTTVRRAATWASFVKLEHTLFSLPVLFGGAVLAADGLPSIGRLGWIALAGAGARTLAMALNRIADRKIDALNPRTASRELPAGRMGLSEATAIALGGLGIYLFACTRLPPLCLWLSPIPVAVFALYPYLKRFTPLAHFGVGFALALAPLGAWVAVTGSLADSWPAVLLAGFTWLWVAGFDIIYATLDEEFDRQAGLHSLPGLVGRRRALGVAAGVHLAAMTLLVALWLQLPGGWAGLAALAGVGFTLVAEHRLAHRVDLAFFQLNILVGFLVLASVTLGVWGV